MMNKGNLSYGLNARSGGGGGNSKGKKKKKGLSGFGDDSDDSSNNSDKDTTNNKTSARSTINKEIQAEQDALRKRAQAAMTKSSTSYNVEYNYDDEYDNFSSNKKKQDAAKQKQISNEPKQSRYISSLLKTSQRRNQEQEVIYERQVQKEQSIEDPLYEGKDKYITSSYKRKLQERELWALNEKERAKREELEDVTKKGKGMGNFMFSGIGRSMLVGSGKDTVDIDDMAGRDGKLGGLKSDDMDTDKRGGTGNRDSSRETEQWDNTKRFRGDNAQYNNNDDDDYTNRKRPPPAFGGGNMNSINDNNEKKKDVPQNTVKTRQQILEDRAIKISEARERYFQRRGITTKSQ